MALPMRMSGFAQRLYSTARKPTVPPAPTLDPLLDTFVARFLPTGDAAIARRVTDEDDEDDASAEASFPTSDDEEGKQSSATSSSSSSSSSSTPSAEKPPPSHRVLLFNLPYARTGGELRMDVLMAIAPEGFTAAAIRDVEVVYELGTGLPSGRAVASMTSEAAAEAAVKNLANSYIGGREVRAVGVVSIIRPRTPVRETAEGSQCDSW